MQLNNVACDLAYKMLCTELGKQLFNDNSPQFLTKSISGLLGYRKLKTSDAGICLESYKAQLKQLSNSAQGTYIEHNCSLLINSLVGSNSYAKTLYGIVLLQQCEVFKNFIQYLVYDDSDSNVLMAEALGLTVGEVTDAVMWLTRTPLFESPSRNISNALSLNSFILYRLTHEPVDSFLSLVEDVIEQLPPSFLSVEKDFEYVEQRQLLQELLRTSTTNLEKGVNILVYGDVGVGKTEFIKALADSIDVTLFKIHSRNQSLVQDSNVWIDASAQPSYRVKTDYLLLMQRLFNQNQGLALLCDEAEDLFSQGFARNEASSESLHEMLETNEIPVIYITNHISQASAAVIRRMSAVIEICVPDNRILKSISDDVFSGLRIRNTFKQRLIENTCGLTPAHLSNAAHVMRLTDLKGKQAELQIEKLVTSNLQAMGVEQPILGYKAHTKFNADYLNIKHQDISYEELLDSVTKGIGVRCLLMGPPGTGKSNLVYQLANGSKRPLVVKTASDILGKYVGENERNLAAAFEEAKSKEAILFFEEFDSFMQSRESANAQWQITQVNELLMQMEQFDYPFFAATNASKLQLDSAALRRFDAKLEFDFLANEQLLNIFCETLNVKRSELSNSVTNTLTRLTNISLGDIAIIKRRQRLKQNKLTLEQAARILVSESDTKRPNRTIGFV